MPYIAPDVIQEAKQMDLFSCLQNYEPQELVYFSGNVYCTRTHDSLKISNGRTQRYFHDIKHLYPLGFQFKNRIVERYIMGVYPLSIKQNVPPNLDQNRRDIEKTQQLSYA